MRLQDADPRFDYCSKCGTVTHILHKVDGVRDRYLCVCCVVANEQQAARVKGEAWKTRATA